MSQMMFKIGSSLRLAVNKYQFATNDAGEIALNETAINVLLFHRDFQVHHLKFKMHPALFCT